MAKRSAAMNQASFLTGSNMPAPVADGLGHATPNPSVRSAVTEHL
ncbi:MAG: hypothetical protein WBE26_12360 [Phycisphaerae bacterium]